MNKGEEIVVCVCVLCVCVCGGEEKGGRSVCNIHEMSGDSPGYG